MSKTSKVKPNKGELFTADALRAAGFGDLRFHQRGLPGTPDVVAPGPRIAGFHHSCFFHAHEGCVCARVPRTNAPFWQRKFATNKSRDRRVRDELERLGWRTITVWECASTYGELGDVAGIIRRLTANTFRHAEVWSRDHRPSPVMER